METLGSPAHRSCRRAFSTAKGGEYDLAVVGRQTQNEQNTHARNVALTPYVLDQAEELSAWPLRGRSWRAILGCVWLFWRKRAKLGFIRPDTIAASSMPAFTIRQARSRQSFAYCDEHKIPYKKCGKLIVAVRACNVLDANEKGAASCGLQHSRSRSDPLLLWLQVNDSELDGLEALYKRGSPPIAVP
eukprot:2155993-Rhodomonas_salina.1